MAVRFQRDPSVKPKRSDRANLAEVIDIRARLVEQTTREALPSGNSAPMTSMRRGDALQHEVPDPDAALHALREDGIRLLARKALSTGELREQLSSRGHAEHDIEHLIGEFESGCYLDDVGLARTITEKMRESKRASRAQIRRKLQERLVQSDAIDEALADLDDGTEEELLREAANERAKRLIGLERVVAERRLIGFLARRGWGGSSTIRIAREALDQARGHVH